MAQKEFLDTVQRLPSLTAREVADLALPVAADESATTKGIF